MIKISKVKTAVFLIIALAFGVLASPSLFAAQFARPDSTVSAGGYTSSSGSQLWQDVDEVTANTTDFIITLNNAQVVHLGLSGVTDPLSSSSHILRIRSENDDNRNTSMTVALYRNSGATLVASFQANMTNKRQWVDNSYTLSGAEADSITDYNDLSVRVTNNSPGDNDEMHVSWIELEIPDLATTPPTIAAIPTLASVQTNGATLGGDITSLGSNPPADKYGTVWNETGSPVVENPSDLSSPSTGPFTDIRTGMKTADQIFYGAYVEQSSIRYDSDDAFFHTYPANDPTIGSFTGIGANSITINWTNSSETGDAAGTIVVVSTVDATITPPQDGTDYTPDAVAPFSVPTTGGGDDYVVYKGTGTNVTISGLTDNTTYYVAVYSASGLGLSGVSGVRYKTPTTATGNQITNATPPVVGNPTFSSVQSNGATLGVDSVTGTAIDDKGTAWKYTTGVVETDNKLTFGTGTGAFSHARTPMNSADQVFFKAYAHNSGGYTLTTESSFYTYPANDPTLGAFTGTDDSNITINWTNSTETGDAAGSIVVVSTADDGFTVPVDATDYTPNAVFPFTSLGGNDYVVYKGTGTSVTISNLPDTTTFYVAVFSASGLGTSGISGVRYKTPTTALGSEATTAPVTPPVVTSPPLFTNVGTTSADLSGTVTDLGAPAATLQGTAWNETGAPVTENTQDEAVTLNVEFTQTRTGMKSADQVFFSSYAKVATTHTYSSVASFYTYPANDPTLGAFTGTDDSNITINWTNSTETGDAAGSIVVVSTADDGFTVPVDATDYTPNAVFPFTSLGGNDYVVYKGTGTSVTISNLPDTTTFYVAVFSASGLGTSGISGVRYKTPTTALGSEATTAPVTPPVVTSPPLFTNVGTTSVDLSGTVTDLGAPAATLQGTAWNETGAPVTENTQDEAVTLNVEFTQSRTGMKSADQVFFSSYAKVGTTHTYSSVASFHTYPAADPTGFSIDQIATSSMRINWTDSSETGDAGGSIVVVSEVDNTIPAPLDGTDYTPDSVAPFAASAETDTGSNDFVVYKGAGPNVTISGLDPNTEYFVAIYSASGLGTSGASGVRYKASTTATGSATTTTGVSQATNLWINNIGQTSMSLRWTRGIGDGSIVVMKQGSAVDVDPTDGTEHVANSTFLSGEDLGGGNRVVYRGNGAFVHVEGLIQGQTYHAAVFTYTGSGVAIDYLLLNPTRANELTINFTPHNVRIMEEDPSITCTTGCHGAHGGPLIPRGAAQETMCITCHQSGGPMAGADTLTNFSLHTNSRGVPLASPGVVDCGSCHELHNPGINDTTYSVNPITLAEDFNAHYFRSNVDKYNPDALTSDAVLHNDTNSEDWAFEGGVGYQGACQVCHTRTSNYQNTSSGDDSHQGDAEQNVNCRGCHDHGTSFAGLGGDCTECHNTVRDSDGAGGNPGRRIVTTEFGEGSIVSSHLPGLIADLDAADCEVCHNHDTGSAHQAGKVNLFNVDTSAGIEIASYIDPRNDQTEAAKLTVFCLACHDADGAGGDPTPFSTNNPVVNIATGATGTAHTDSSASCFGDGEFGCHGSGHGGQKLALLAPAETGPGTSPDFTDENETFCLNCHDGGTPVLTPAAPDILADLGGSFAVSVEKVEADSGAFVNQNHDILPADKDWNAANDPGSIRPQISCSDCHLPPHDATAGSPVKDPDTGATFAGTYAKNNTYNDNIYSWSYQDSAADQSPITPEGMVTPHDSTDFVEFCLTCHDGDPPPGIVMSAGLLDIASVYDQEYHGSAPNGGTGTSINRGGMKAPWTAGGDSKNEDPSAPYAAFPCTMCHGPHGSGNIFNLKTEITVAGKVMSTGSWGTGDPMDSIIGTYYELPRFGPGGTQENRVWGAWCTFCHQLSAHSYGEDQVCRSGHQHGGSNF